MVDQSTTNEETLVFCLAYCSRATRPLCKADIQSLITVSRSRNSEQKITGWLVYGSNIFIQWLEGSRKDVKLVMDSIIADSRHDAIVVLTESEKARKRLFGGWDMELVSADDIRDVLTGAIGKSDDPKNTEALRVLLDEVD